jgi:predicted nucleic acid-binding protein
VTKRIVLDASVAVKWFHDEEFTREALKIRDAADKGRLEIIVPSIFPYEVINALRKPPNLFEKEQLKSAGESIELRGLLGENADKGDLSTILELTFKHSINPYDASYMLMASRFKTRVITADKKLAKSIGNEDLALFIGSRKLQKII